MNAVTLYHIAPALPRAERRPGSRQLGTPLCGEAPTVADVTPAEADLILDAGHSFPGFERCAACVARHLRAKQVAA